MRTFELRILLAWQFLSPNRSASHPEALPHLGLVSERVGGWVCEDASSPSSRHETGTIDRLLNQFTRDMPKIARAHRWSGASPNRGRPSFNNEPP